MPKHQQLVVAGCCRCSVEGTTAVSGALQCSLYADTWEGHGFWGKTYMLLAPLCMHSIQSL